MSGLGRTRQRLADILNSAFAEGLLSEQTHAYRLGLLFTPGLVDQGGLIGDLANRRSRGMRSNVRQPWVAALEGVRELIGRAARTEAPLLLSLAGLGYDELVVGRAPACDIVLRDIEISRRHARLVFRDGTWLIQDLRSTNGTTVNGVRVGRSALRSGDLVGLGPQLIQID